MTHREPEADALDVRHYIVTHWREAWPANWRPKSWRMCSFHQLPNAPLCSVLVEITNEREE